MNHGSCALRLLLAGAALVACMGASEDSGEGSRWILDDGYDRCEADDNDQEAVIALETDPECNARRARDNRNQLERDRARALESARLLEKVTDRPSRLAELEVWASRFHGRFRIEGEIESTGGFPRRPTTGKIRGIAECAGIGDGPGVQCALSATWPIIDSANVPASLPVILPPSPSEALRTFNPAVLVFGIDPKLLEVRVMLVTSDTLTHSWAGVLVADTLDAVRVTPCRELSEVDRLDARCIRSVQLRPGQDSGIIHMDFIGNPLRIRFVMHRDPDAGLEKPLKTRKSR
jgi:hypothetical protein